MSEHAGHRARHKERYVQTGLEGFDDAAALELLLHYAIPRRDTKPLAKQLLAQFGNLATVMEAPLEQLQQVDGMGEHSAILVNLVHQIARRHLIQRATFAEILPSTAACGEYLVPFFFGLRDEVVYLLCLDAKCMVLDCRQLFEGSVNTAGVSVRKIVERAMACNATSVVLAHNHTNGLAVPSREDEETTRQLIKAMEAVGIRLIDHIVVAGEDFVSMADSSYLNHLF